MAITSSKGFDGTINEAEWSTLHSVVNDGHVEGMVASVGSGTREVDLTSGTAWAVGTYHVASATTVALAANGSGNTRIDTIVVNINFSTNTATITSVQGTPAASPVAPTLTQTAGTEWEIPLCDVVVVDGETAFSTADITDRRPYRPFVQHGLKEISMGGSDSATSSVTFPVPYAVAPSVVAAGQDSNFIRSVSSVTTTGFQLACRTRTGTTSSSTLDNWWIAVGRLNA